MMQDTITENQPNPKRTSTLSFLSGMGPINPKTFTMPNNAQFTQKLRSFQNTLQQLTLDWIDILQECTKNDGVHTQNEETEKILKDTKISNEKYQQK
jgi:enamine deaminase RidA (YjgF/YER057c/UK114 family)